MGNSFNLLWKNYATIQAPLILYCCRTIHSTYLLTHPCIFTAFKIMDYQIRNNYIYMTTTYLHKQHNLILVKCEHYHQYHH